MNKLTRIAIDVDPAHALTASDFEHFMKVGALDDMRAELVNGAIEKMMPANFGHGEQHFRLAGQLYLALQGSGVRVASDLAIYLDEANVRAPDLAVMRNTPARGSIPDARDVLLAIEISDTTLGRDLGRKRVDYATVGIQHYWIVDIGAQIVRKMTNPQQGAYAEEAIVRFGEPIAIPGTDRTITID